MYHAGAQVRKLEEQQRLDNLFAAISNSGGTVFCDPETCKAYTAGMCAITGERTDSQKFCEAESETPSFKER